MIGPLRRDKEMLNRGGKVRIWRTPSKSSDKEYNTVLWEDGTYSCDCPGWTFKKGEKDRTCTHLEKIAPLVATGQLPSEPIDPGGFPNLKPPMPLPDTPWGQKLLKDEEYMAAKRSEQRTAKRAKLKPEQTPQGIERKAGSIFQDVNVKLSADLESIADALNKTLKAVSAKDILKGLGFGPGENLNAASVEKQLRAAVEDSSKLLLSKTAPKPSAEPAIGTKAGYARQVEFGVVNALKDTAEFGGRVFSAEDLEDLDEPLVIKGSKIDMPAGSRPTEYTLAQRGEYQISGDSGWGSAAAEVLADEPGPGRNKNKRANPDPPTKPTKPRRMVDFG
jgi:hypothetical protein